MRSRKHIKRYRYSSKGKPTRISLQEIYQRDNGICAGCGFPVDYSQATRDHRIPKSRGGSNKLKNLQLMCRSCNQFKADTLVR
jgi:5-methylcytosine-specific restriction endonuclease McrA